MRTHIHVRTRRAAGHDHVVQVLDGYATFGLPLPSRSRSCTPPTSFDDGTLSPLSSTSGFNSLSSMADSEGRLRSATTGDLDASAKVRVAGFAKLHPLRCVHCATLCVREVHAG